MIYELNCDVTATLPKIRAQWSGYLLSYDLKSFIGISKNKSRGKSALFLKLILHHKKELKIVYRLKYCAPHPEESKNQVLRMKGSVILPNSDQTR